MNTTTAFRGVRPDNRSRTAPPAVAGPVAGPGSARARQAVGLGVVSVVGWSAALWVSSHVQVDPTLHRVALFAHLASLVAGLGAALTVDCFALQWVLGRKSLREVLMVSRGTSLLVWTGLAGLVGTGALLSPDLGSGLTRMKLGLVLVVALNGAFAGFVQHRLEAAGDGATRSLLAQGVAAATVSQVGWWGAAVVGFLNRQY